MTTWIPVTERLPEKYVFVLGCNRHWVADFKTTLLYVSGRGEWFFGQDDLCHMPPTHWQPLPEPPKET